MGGWIKLHHSIRDHWLWEHPQKVFWWIDIIMDANYDDRKVLIGGEIITCARGQTIRSLSSWANRWGVSKDTARNFFSLLEKDKMILHENLSISTRITICNYDTYQGCLHDEQTQTGSKPEHNKKERKKYIKKESQLFPKDEFKFANWKQDFNVYVEYCKNGFREAWEDRKFMVRLEQAHPEMDTKKTMDNAFLKYWSLESTWEKKRQSRSQTLRWKDTLMKTIHFNISPK
jgi:hypothetical protein